MGASLTMIDRHYGHLARDGREHAINLLDAFTGSETVDRRPYGQRKDKLSRKNPEAL